MDDGPHWWSSIARELEVSTAELPRLIQRVDEVLASERTTDSEAIEAESIIERIEVVLRDIQTAINSSDENKERLRASADLLREEIAAADETIARLLQRKATP